MALLRIGIAPQQIIRQRTLDIAAGRYVPSHDEPSVWFTSLESLAQVLSEENRAILSIIQQHHPESVSALADLVGRAQPNVYRTLKKMESYGIVELQKIKGKSVPYVKYDEFQLFVSAMSTHNSPYKRLSSSAR